MVKIQNKGFTNQTLIFIIMLIIGADMFWLGIYFSQFFSNFFTKAPVLVLGMVGVAITFGVGINIINELTSKANKNKKINKEK